jgi:hypothetical protein
MANPDDYGSVASFADVEALVGKGLAATIARKGGCYALAALPNALFESLLGTRNTRPITPMSPRVNPSPEAQSTAAPADVDRAMLLQRIVRLIDPTPQRFT